MGIDIKAMKILIASDAYIYQTNGVRNVVITLANGLKQLGHDVRVLAPANGRESFKKDGDCFIRSFPSFLYPDVRLCPVHSDPLINELEQWKPDLIHVHTEADMARLAFKIAAVTGAPVVITAHTDYATYAFKRFHESRPVRVTMKAFGKRFYRHAKAVVAPSEKARRFAQLQPAANRVTVIPNGIRLERYQKPVSPEEKAALFQRYGLTDNGCTLVMVTRVSREKNIMEILHYFPALLRAVPEAQLFIAGDGPDRERLEAYTAHNGLSERVRFAGRIEPDEVYRYYALGDVFVSASTFEVHSMTYLEAMACGLPLVCREDASLLHVLDNGENGFIYNTESGFVEAVSRILRDRPLREAMHKRALEKADEFSDRRFVERTVALYEKVVGR